MIVHTDEEDQVKHFAHFPQTIILNRNSCKKWGKEKPSQLKSQLIYEIPYQSKKVSFIVLKTSILNLFI